ncbi:MAG: dTDP-glucose 4,6-dehydratase [Chloroflexi bacterium]|nr:dTDP-glucose 4,6-dehydratase [Chloroflexota bacterium]MCL5074121.1 dTDP-glucose 4,6-dehydratase [Chloroflexota bacterium]
MKHILVTGGAGFIGSNFVRYMLRKYDHYHIVVLDKLTYAGNLDNLQDVTNDPRYKFIRGDICDARIVEETIHENDIAAIINFAAETHVDRSLLEPGSFIMTDVFGTYVLLEAARRHNIERFLQVSTDEVYGEVLEGSSLETDRLAARSPYSASKAGGELMVQAYHISYDLPVVITRGSNTFGPYQYPEKVVSLFITNAIDDLPLPIYGDGLQVRDHLYVLDHCEGIDLVLHKGQDGEIYNIGAGNEVQNIDLAKLILSLLGKSTDLIQHIADRPGHDRRYALNWGKIQTLGWQPHQDFATALAHTVCWYQDNEWWWRKIKSGEYAEYYRKNYGYRLHHG